MLGNLSINVNTLDKHAGVFGTFDVPNDRFDGVLAALHCSALRIAPTACRLSGVQSVPLWLLTAEFGQSFASGRRLMPQP